MTGIGTLPAYFIERAYRLPGLLRLPLLTLSGWGLASLASAVAAAAQLDQTGLARALVALGLVLLLPFGGRTNRGQRLQLLSDLAVLLVLVAPMGVLVAGTPAAAFDEFAQWLPNTRFVVEHAHYWVWPEWVGLSSKPGYPNASVTVALLVSQLLGPEVEASFKTFVVILLGGYGAVLAHLAATRLAEPPRPWLRWLAIAALLAAGCFISFIDPVVDPRISFTSYTDTPTAITLAIVGLVACYGIAAARRGDNGIATSWFAWTGLLSLTLILLRTTNLVLIAAIVGGCAALLVSLRAGSVRLWIRWAFLLIVPAAVGDLIWMTYLRIAGIGPDISPRPLSLWNWAAPSTVAKAFFFDRLGGNRFVGEAALGLVVLALIIGLLVWRRADKVADGSLPPPRLIVALTAIVGVCFALFLTWVYIAVFSDEEVASAASLWRYLTELGPLVVVAVCCTVLTPVAKRQWNERLIYAAAILGVVSLTLLPLVGRRYYDLDCRFPDIVAARKAITELRLDLEPFAHSATSMARVAVVNPTVGDWMAYALAFDMRWPASDRLVQFRVKNEPLAETENWAWDHGLDALLDFRSLDRTALHAQSTIPAVSLLGRPAAKGGEWKVLATTKPRPRPICSIFR
jgi:hypothetical protein